MAQLALAAAGAVVGSFFGNPAAGWAVGAALGGILFPQHTSASATGPRLGDLTVQSSAYGAAKPKGWGTITIAGNVIWAMPIKETSSTSSSSSGGKGGATQTQTSTTYTYSATFAVALAEGPCEDITRIWADGTLIFDKTGSGPITQKSGLVFRLYKGDETQLPDGLIEADKGAGNVPAYRGTVYVVFDTLQLADYGNRIPNLIFEVAFNAAPQTPVTRYTVSSGETDFAYQAPYYWSGAVYDPVRDTLIGLSGTPSAQIIKFAVPSMDETVSLSQTSMFSSYAVSGGITQLTDVDLATGDMFAPLDIIPSGGSGVYRGAVVKIDPTTLKVVAGYPADFDTNLSPPAWISPLYSGQYGYPYGVAVNTPVGGQSVVAVVTADYLSSGGGKVYVGLLKASDMSYIWDVEVETGPLASASNVWDKPIAGPNDTRSVTFYWPVSKPSGLVGGYFTTTSLDINATVVTIDGGGYDVSGVNLLVNITAAELQAKGGTGAYTAIFPYATTRGMGVYDPDSNALILSIDVGSGPDILGQVTFSVDATSGTVNWALPPVAVSIPNRVPSSMMNAQIAKSPYFVTADFIGVGNAPLNFINKYTGVIVTTLNLTEWDADPNGFYPLAYLPDINALLTAPNTIGATAGDGIGLMYLNRTAAGATTLKQIIDDLSADAGLAPSDIDTSELAGINVSGYVLGSQMAVRDAVAPLMQAFFFDGIESDYQVKFLTRGRASTRTITQEEFIRDDTTGAFWTPTITDDVQLPYMCSVQYIDPLLDYQQGTQYTKRVAQPYQTMNSQNNITAQVPIVLSGDDAKALSEKLLYTPWVERYSYAGNLSWKHIDLDPSDVITVDLDDGTTMLTRITVLDVGADLSLAITALSEQTAAYSSAAVSQNNFNPGEVVGGDGSVYLKVHNLPLLADTHDQGRLRGVLYYQAGNYIESASWGGCTVYQSIDQITWNQIGRIVEPLTYGMCGGVLAAPAEVFSIDTVNTLTIWPVTGETNLESITGAQLLDGALNMLAVGDEVINFQNVTNNGDGSYTLDTFLRGRRGTDTLAASHAANEHFYLLNTTNTQVQLIPLGDIGYPLYFKAVGSGQALEDAQVVTITPEGNDLKPYAPVNATRAANTPSAGDITLAWNRRTRINGNLYGGGAIVPLNEDSESYSIDILSGHAGSVLRTLTASSESVVYSSANVVTDFGGPPATLYCRIYQISAEVGRGSSYEFAIEA